MKYVHIDTAICIPNDGSMQTSNRLPRVLSTLKRAVDLLKPDQTFTVILFDQGYYTDPSGRGLQPISGSTMRLEVAERILYQQ